MAKKQANRKIKVCSSCGTENRNSVSECKSCGKSRFEPEWVLAKRSITRQTSVQITNSSPEFGDVEKRITLSKWWPGGRATFHISRPTQWEAIRNTIDKDLAPIIGWKTAQVLVNEATEAEKQDEVTTDSYKTILDQHPDFLKNLVRSIDFSSLSTRDFESIQETLAAVADAASNADSAFRQAFIAVVQKLPKQESKALNELDDLLEGWSLQVVINVSRQVQSRIDRIDLLEDRINDPRTFEIKGDASIHRILERSMWLVDERYWLLHSNTTLLKQIGEEMSKRDKKKYGKKRPDFVCGTVGEKLIILELKRPKHTLEVEDLNQLEQYVMIAESYFKFASYEAYLVGKKTSDDLKRTIKHRSSRFKILHYANLIDDVKKRYATFLKTIEED